MQGFKTENMFLYKYLKKEYAYRMLEFGDIKLGTAYEYRSYEDIARRDIDEATRTLVSKIDIPLYANKQNQLPGIFSSIIKINDGSIILENCIAERKENYPDVYIYCCTSSFDDKAMKSFDCDSCIVIKDVPKFVNCIRSNLETFFRKVETFSEPCKYDGKKVPFGSKNSPYFIKDKSFEYQEEYRLIFRPKNLVEFRPLSPFFLRCPDLLSCIELYQS